MGICFIFFIVKICVLVNFIRGFSHIRRHSDEIVVALGLPALVQPFASGLNYGCLEDSLLIEVRGLTILVLRLHEIIRLSRARTREAIRVVLLFFALSHIDHVARDSFESRICIELV